MRTFHRVVWLVCFVIGLVLSASGCVAPNSCGPQGCPVTKMCPTVQPYATICRPPMLSEPHWPYVDVRGQPALMGDSHLRSHLGLPGDPPAEN